MDLQIISAAVGIGHTISAIAWTGSIIFILTVTFPVMSHLQGEVHINSNVRLFRLSEIYLRIWGIFTFVLGISLYILPLAKPLVIIHRFDPLDVFFIEAVTFVAYIIVGEGYLFRNMRRYRVLSNSLEQKEKSQDIAHMNVLEKMIYRFMLIQLALLMALVVASAYFPFTYAIP